MHVDIRPQVPEDYAAIGALEGETAEATAAQAANNPQFVGIVAVADGRVIGRASAGFMHQHTQVGDLRCRVVVAPEARRRGVGSALWAALLEGVRVHRPAHLRANGDPREPETVAWAERRGFTATHHLKFQELDLSLLPAYEVTSSYRFVPFAQLHTPQNERRLHELFQRLGADTPDADEWEYEPFEPWRAWTVESENAWPAGWVVAIAPDGEWAGFTLAQKDGPGRAHIFMTGVERAHRGHGLGFALKAEAARIAAAAGFARMSTLNHAANKPILAINQRLGFAVAEEILRLVRPCSW